MEYMNHGSLYDVLHNESVVVEGEFLLPILRDISQGVRFLHSADPEIIHGDLKAQNILVDINFRAKVTDFGLSQKRRLGATGSPYWMAPELLRGEAHNSPETDVYSFGVIIFEVYARKDPYEGEKPDEVLRLVADPEVNKRPTLPTSCPPLAKAMMVECFSEDPAMRPTFEDINSRLRGASSADVQPIEWTGSKHDSRSSHTNALLEELGKGNRSPALLSECFPEKASKALQESRAVEAQECSCATVICANIADFDDIAERLPKEKLVDLLDRLHMRLGQLCKIHHVFKVETNGSAFIGVTNLVEEQPDHAKLAADFCVAAMKAANETMIDIDQSDLKSVRMSFGLHSGPLTADVVGSRLPRYCLFGDTVSTARRLATTTYKGSIQCSDLTACLMEEQRSEISLKRCGPISLKGQGFVVGYAFVVNDQESTRHLHKSNSSK